MKTLLKILGFLAFLLVVLILSILGVGSFADKEFAGEKSKTYPYNQQKVWNTLTNLEDLPNRREEVVKVEFLEKDTLGHTQWKEHMDMGGYALFERTEHNEPTLFAVNMKESTFGMNGTWSYQLEKVNEQETKVTVAEKSEITSTWVRGIMTLVGRDKNLALELQHLEDALKQ